MKKRTRRKVWPLVNPIHLAIDGAAVLDGPKLDRLRMIELQAVDAFARGSAKIDDWRAIADVANLAQTLCEMGVGKAEVMPVQLQVEAALADSHTRYVRTQRIATTGPGLQAMRELIDFHDLQRVSVARSVYEEAIARTRNKIRSADPKIKVYASEREIA